MTLLAAAAVLLVLAIGGAALIVRFVDSEWQRELRAWQVRLGIVADSRFAAVDDWLDRQFDELAGLADNASLQLYMTQLATSAANPDDADVADAQGEYLQNLIAACFAIACLGPGRWSLDNAIDFQMHGWWGFATAVVIGFGGTAALLVVFWRPPAPAPPS